MTQPLPPLLALMMGHKVEPILGRRVFAWISYFKLREFEQKQDELDRLLVAEAIERETGEQAKELGRLSKG